MKCSLCGIVVYFNPNSYNLRCSLENLAVLDYLIVVVNGEWSEEFANLEALSNVSFLIEGRNLGIARATNDGVRFAKELGWFTDLVLLDQDTVLPRNYRRLIDYRQVASKSGQVGIIAPVAVNPKTGVVSRQLIFRRFRFERFEIFNEVVEVSAPIASGSLIRIDVFEWCGLLDEKLFIDYVDTEFALRLISRGYRNYVARDVRMAHELGDQRLYRLFGLVVKPTNHSPVRKYFISRNRWHVAAKYVHLSPSILAFEVLAFLLDLFRVLFFESNRGAKLKNIALGLIDFARGRYGPYPY